MRATIAGVETTTACAAADHAAAPLTQDAGWHRAARWARVLAWITLGFVAVEGTVGLYEGVQAQSIALTGWALGAIPEGLASVMVLWRFTGSRTLSHTAERRAQIGVAVSFWLLAPYIAAESLRHLFAEREAETSVVGIVLTTVALIQMPTIGRLQRKLGDRLRSAATKGEGAQNYLCGAQAAAVLIGLAVTANWSGGWWLDPAIGLGIAGVAVWQGVRAWRGEDCGC